MGSCVCHHGRVSCVGDDSRYWHTKLFLAAQLYSTMTVCHYSATAVQHHRGTALHALLHMRPERSTAQQPQHTVWALYRCVCWLRNVPMGACARWPSLSADDDVEERWTCGLCSLLLMPFRCTDDRLLGCRLTCSLRLGYRSIWLAASSCMPSMRRCH